MNLLHGDCLELMKDIPDNSIDLILTDPPYGTTRCKWDTVIDFELMWLQLKRITKDNGAICLFGSEPFSSALRMSNIKMFKYDWVWEKNRPTNFMTKTQPLRKTENISVFEGSRFFAQPRELAESSKSRNTRKPQIRTSPKGSQFSIGIKEGEYKNREIGRPINILKYNTEQNNQYVKKVFHPTQKPVALLEYLIKTYTLENETVLDFTMGSGSTGVACKNLNRNFIGIEMDDKYFQIAKERIESHIPISPIMGNESS